MLASRKSQSPWRRGRDLGPKVRASSWSSRCRCTSQWCPPFPRPRRSRWGWRRPRWMTEGDKQRKGLGHTCLQVATQSNIKQPSPSPTLSWGERKHLEAVSFNFQCDLLAHFSFLYSWEKILALLETYSLFRLELHVNTRLLRSVRKWCKNIDR